MDQPCELSRDELRKKLRAKMKDKRSGKSSMESLGKNLKSDPMSALLSMGVDDVDLLNDSKKIVKNPESYLKSVRSEKRFVNDTDTKSDINCEVNDDVVEGLPDFN